MSFRLYLRHPPHVVYRAIALGATVTILVLGIARATSLFRPAEMAAYDMQFSLRGDRAASRDIVIVTLDEKSLLALGVRDLPIARRWFARAIDVLHRDGAKAIGIDYIFLTPSPFGQADDRALADAAGRARNVVLGNALDDGGQSVVLPNYRPLARVAAGEGFINVRIDPDGKVRSIDLVETPGAAGTPSSVYPSFAVKLASIALREPVMRSIAGLPRRRMLIDYVGRESVQDLAQNAFDTVAFSDVVQARESPETFRNKIVLIVPYFSIFGGAQENLRSNTPLGPMFAGFVEANALNTILRGDPMLPTGDTVDGLLILLLGLVSTAFATQLSLVRSAAAMVFVGFGFLLGAVILFQRFHLWIEVAAPVTALLVAAVAVMALRVAIGWVHARRNRREISILFVDIRGYTAMSENLEPERVADALDIYLGALTRCARSFGGTIAKYVGDEMIVLWNAPYRQDDHAMLAVSAAVEMVSRMGEINDRLRARGLPSIRYGIGINSGEAVVGRMDAYSKQYDVLGDTVNTAARLCSAADGAEIIVGETTRQLIADRVDFEATDPLTLKGKSQPLRTFRVLAVHPNERVVPEAVGDVANLPTP